MQGKAPKPGPLYLVPSPLGGPDARSLLPAASLDALKTIRDFVVENEKTAWRTLTAVFSREELDGTSMSILNEHTPPSEVQALLRPALSGRPLGMLSEAGCPGVADPGAALVAAAHRSGVPVKPLVGPSAILLALMASGMNGQSFRFRGYLPRERSERAKALKSLEKLARDTGETQIFIEAPYRNDHMLQDMLACLKPDTLACVAIDMSLEGEKVVCARISGLAAALPGIGKKPAVFLLGVPG